MEAIEEKFYALNQMTFEIFEKLRIRFSNEKAQIQKELDNGNFGISNLEKAINCAVSLSANLALAWDQATVMNKEKLQNLIFPKGITYNSEKGAVRTEKVNFVFLLIARLAIAFDIKEKGQNSFSDDLALVVVPRGIEPLLQE